MKQLYESILTSTNSGKQKYISDFKEWFTNTTAGKLCKSPNMKIDVAFENGCYKVNITNARRSMVERLSFSKKDLEQNEFLFKISELNITLEGKTNPSNIEYTYMDLHFQNTKQMIRNATRLVFYNCTIDDFDGKYFDNDIRIVHFATNQFYENCGQSYVNKMHDLKVIYIENDRQIYSTGCTYGLHCKLSNMKSNNISKFFISITENMFDTENVIDYENNRLTVDASKELDRFLKNNNVDLNGLVFRCNEKRGFSNTKYSAKLVKDNDIYILKWTTAR